MKRGRIERDGGTVVNEAWRADRWWQRLRGLLFRPALAADGSQALLIVPCNSVHTIGMAYPLDVVFLDRQQRVCGWKEQLVPWRAAGCRGARSTVELHGGSLGRLNPQLGETWTWQAVSP